ncbi:MAG TPA: hypothetical protein VGK40_05195, partial [Verrucomicrobiae bacterium]
YPAGFIPATGSTEDCDQVIIVPPTPPSYPPSMDPQRPDYRRAWFNNRGFLGTLLDVRFNYFDLDGPASQQQWP